MGLTHNYLILYFMIWYIITWMLHQIFIKWCSQLARITIPPIYPFRFTPTVWSTWPINKVHIYKLNWREILPCQYIHVLYPISIVMRLCAVLSYLSSIFSINMHIISPKQGYWIQRKLNINVYIIPWLLHQIFTFPYFFSICSYLWNTCWYIGNQIP